MAILQSLFYAMDNTLTIGRLNGRYTLPAQHPQPERVQARLDDVVRKDGTAVIGRLLDQTLPADDPSIWLIRRLDFTLLADVGRLEADELGQLWGRQVTQTIVQAIANGPDGQNVLRFPHRAAFVAQFVADVADGAAADKWYYQDFAGLRHLLPGQAIREAIVREGATAVPILRHLAQNNRLEHILRALSDSDAARLVEILPDAATADQPAWDQVLAVWPSVARTENGRFATPKNQLRLWLAVAEQSPDTPSLTAVTHLLQLADVLKTTADPLVVARHVGRGELAAAVALARRSGARDGLESLPAWQEAAAGDPDWPVVVAKTLVPVTAVRPTPSPGQTFMSPLGGLFLLLPILVDLRVPELVGNLTQRRRGAEGEEEISVQPRSAASHFLYWLALKCLGGARAAQWRDDPALLLALGLAEAPDEPPEFSPRQLADLRQAWRGLLRDQGRIDGRFLALDTNVTSRPEKEIEISLQPRSAASYFSVLRDMRYDYWLDIGLPLDVQLTIDHWPLTIDHFHLLTDDERPDWLATAVPDYAAKAKPAAATLAYCALPNLPPDLDATLTLLAQGILRTFARHLLGFAWSSPAYIYDNFLIGDSQITLTADEIRVQLPPSPLHTVLRLTGWHDRSYTLPWLPERNVRVSG
ncbi:MAG: hypothetical protein IPJ94_07295 [Chloroflexi bacterium]|nr:hypothetical protein [Chloroflexota bacterium]